MLRGASRPRGEQPDRLLTISVLGRKALAELGAMPANVFESVRASVTAGLAKLVELVNQ